MSRKARSVKKKNKQTKKNNGKCSVLSKGKCAISPWFNGPKEDSSGPNLDLCRTIEHCSPFWKLCKVLFWCKTLKKRDWIGVGEISAVFFFF